MWLLVTAANAQQVPEGDFESPGDYTGWSVTPSSQASVVSEIYSGLQGNQVLNISRGSDGLAVCSSLFTVTTEGVTAEMHEPNGVDHGTYWWLDDLYGGTSPYVHESPSEYSDPYSTHTLDATSMCGVEVVLCLEPNPGSQTDYDDFRVSGSPCPQYVDGDGDGYCPQGRDLDASGDCAAAGEFDDPAIDCDDLDDQVFSAQIETCNGKDDDCDGEIDEGFDADGDGVLTCDGDCDDADAAIGPDAEEVCDGVDDDCDEAIDEGFDADGDGATSCGEDCDDADPAVGPGAEEVCNGVDDDCDGQIDEHLGPRWWPDADGDGYGDGSAEPVRSCETLGVRNADDCDDSDPSVHEGCGGGDGGPRPGRAPADEGDDAVGCTCDQVGGAAWVAWILVPLVARRRGR